MRVKSCIKLDMDKNSCDWLLRKYHSTKLLDKLIIFGLRLATCIVAETEEVFSKIKQENVFGNNFIKIPNALLKESILAPLKPYSKREDKIIVVGRIGAPVKNHQLLLDTLSKMESIGKWTIDLIGPIEDSFKKTIDAFFKQNSRYNGIVNFVGSKNRKGISEIYSEAKVFLLTSKSESFCCALIEAAYFGCYIISTDVGGAREITNNGKYGTLYEDCNLKRVLNNLDDNVMKESYSERVEYGRKNFILEPYINIIHNELEQVK